MKEDEKQNNDLNPIEKELKELIEKGIIDEDIIKLLDSRETAVIFPKEMSNKYPPEKNATSKEIRRGWELAGLKCGNQRRFSDAIEIFDNFYDWLLEYQDKTRNRITKGLPLVWMAHFLTIQGYLSLAKRFLMLTLIEDSIESKANIKPETSGVYFRLVWQFGMDDSDLKRYTDQIYKIYTKNPSEGMFPEWILQEIDKEWITNIPSPNESLIYRVNRKYINFLLNKLGSGTGKELERLGEYILSQIPGFRTYRNEKTPSTEYDIICSIEGIESDFRSKLGRYFICECKDWDEPADFTIIAKFCRILDSAKCKFGIIFSKEGITGKGRTKFAEREIIKVFQDRGTAIVIIDENDLKDISKGKNFITILRTKYEKARLDLYPVST